MTMPHFKNMLLAFSVSALSIGAFGQEKKGYVKGGVKFDPPPKEDVSDIANTELKSQMVEGEYLYQTDVDITDDPSWQVIWQNKGVYRKNDGGRGNVRYREYMDESLAHLFTKESIRKFYGPSDYSADYIGQSDNLTSIHWSAWRVKDTEKSIYEKNSRRDFNNMGQFHTQYYEVYAHGDDDPVVNPDVDPLVQKTLVIRLPYAYNGKTYNRTTVISWDESDPNALLFADYMTDGNGMLIPNNDIANAGLKVRFAKEDVVHKEFDYLVGRAGELDTNGAREVAKQVASFMRDAAYLPDVSLEKSSVYGNDTYYYNGQNPQYRP